MKRIVWLALLVPTLPVAAQEGGADGARAAYERLLAEFNSDYEAFVARRSELFKTEAYLQARKDRDAEAAQKLLDSVTPIDMAAWREKFSKAAEEYAGTDGAVPFLTWIVQRGQDVEAAKEAVDVLLESHLASDALVDVAEYAPYFTRMLGAEAAAAALDKMAEKAANAHVRAWALYARAQGLQGREASQEDKARADDLLAKACELAKGTILEMRIQAPAFEAEHLQIGMQVPDIEGQDIDGVDFKLSDYRGKVVVLDFWGDW